MRNSWNHWDWWEAWVSLDMWEKNRHVGSLETCLLHIFRPECWNEVKPQIDSWTRSLSVSQDSPFHPVGFEEVKLKTNGMSREVMHLSLWTAHLAFPSFPHWFSGSLVDDESLIGVLRTTKLTAARAVKNYTSLQKRRSRLTLPRRSSGPCNGNILYFLITEMSMVNIMCQTSLAQFLKLFDQSMARWGLTTQQPPAQTVCVCLLS